MINFDFMNFEYMGRIILAALCGFIIGYERKNRKKEAGVRTHCIVALASALMMIVSKYGFFDLMNYPEIKLDPSRVASQIVTGVGFLGAGMIFVHRNNVKGLTTAAGIWATCGIGMAIGAGLYFIGVLSSVIIFIIQIILHKDFKLLRSQTDETLVLLVDKSENSFNILQAIFNNYSVGIDSLKINKDDEDSFEIVVEGDFTDKEKTYKLIDSISQLEFVKSVEI